LKARKGGMTSAIIDHWSKFIFAARGGGGVAKRVVVVEFVVCGCHLGEVFSLLLCAL
jgi:hypothetical protein